MADKIDWVSAGLRPPPDGALTMTIKTDPATAKALRERAYRHMADELARDPLAARFIQIAMPTAKGDRLIISLDGKRLDDLVEQYARAMRQAMQQMQAASRPAATTPNRQ